jgi:hypothetical protein
MSDYFTPEDVAQMFGLPSANYVRENARLWPHIRIAKQIRFTPEHVEQIARLHEHTPAEPTTSRNTFGRRTRGAA